jgi:hypothetical protein
MTDRAQFIRSHLPRVPSDPSPVRSHLSYRARSQLRFSCVPRQHIGLEPALGRFPIQQPTFSSVPCRAAAMRPLPPQRDIKVIHDPILAIRLIRNRPV